MPTKEQMVRDLRRLGYNGPVSYTKDVLTSMVRTAVGSGPGAIVTPARGRRPVAVKKAVPRKAAAPAKKAAPRTTAAVTPVTDAHRRDMERLAKNLREAAERHDLCDQFYDEIEELNRGLTVPLEINRKMRGTYSFNVTITGEGFPTERDGRWGYETPKKEFDIKVEREITAALESLLMIEDVDTEIISVEDFDFMPY